MSTKQKQVHYIKDEAMLKEKELMTRYQQKILTAKEDGKKLCYTFLPGGLTELLHCFDIVPVFPEVLGLQMGLRKKSGVYIEAGENDGYSEDVCSYVKAGVGLALNGNMGPDGMVIPKPDFLFLVASQCFTFMKWWEILRKTYDCPIVTVHIPWRHHGKTTPEEYKFGVNQFKQAVIPQLEEISGVKFDIDKLREILSYSREMEQDLADVINMGKLIPSPIEGFFQTLYYNGPINTYYRGTKEGVEFYKLVKRVVQQRIDSGESPQSPHGKLDEQKYRLVMDCGITWDNFSEYSKIFYDEKAIIVAATYAKVAGTFDRGNFHDPDRPLESLIENNMTNYCNLSLEDRVKLMEDYIREYKADGFLVGSIKSCKSFAAGMLSMLREIEKRTGVPGGFFELDMMDARYFSEANVRNRIESYLRMIDERRRNA